MFLRVLIRSRHHYKYCCLRFGANAKHAMGLVVLAGQVVDETCASELRETPPHTTTSNYSDWRCVSGVSPQSAERKCRAGMYVVGITSRTLGKGEIRVHLACCLTLVPTLIILYVVGMLIFLPALLCSCQLSSTPLPRHRPHTQGTYAATFRPAAVFVEQAVDRP